MGTRRKQRLCSGQSSLEREPSCKVAATSPTTIDDDGQEPTQYDATNGTSSDGVSAEDTDTDSDLGLEDSDIDDAEGNILLEADSD